jgi:hypothetical protein
MCLLRVFVSLIMVAHVVLFGCVDVVSCCFAMMPRGIHMCLLCHCSLPFLGNGSPNQYDGVASRRVIQHFRTQATLPPDLFIHSTKRRLTLDWRWASAHSNGVTLQPNAHHPRRPILHPYRRSLRCLSDRRSYQRTPGRPQVASHRKSHGPHAQRTLRQPRTRLPRWILFRLLSGRHGHPILAFLRPTCRLRPVSQRLPPPRMEGLQPEHRRRRNRRHLARNLSGPAGQYECVYANMPRFGLAQAGGTHTPATGHLRDARTRMAPPPPPA